MSASVRLLFFCIALFTMALFAAGSMLMAVGHHGWLSTVAFVFAILIAGMGFVMKRRLQGPRPQPE